MSASTGPTSAIGVDVIEIERGEAALARFGERVLRRVYTAGEGAFCRGRVQGGAGGGGGAGRVSGGRRGGGGRVRCGGGRARPPGAPRGAGRRTLTGILP